MVALQRLFIDFSFLLYLHLFGEKNVYITTHGSIDFARPIIDTHVSSDLCPPPSLMIVAVILSHGLRANVKNSAGRTPLLVCVEDGHGHTVAKALCEQTAHIQAYYM